MLHLMNRQLTALLMMAALSAGRALGQEPDPQPPRDHVDSTVVGDARSDSADGAVGVSGDNDHHFTAGAPEIVAATQKLHLSKSQQSQLSDVIQRADAGAAVLIRRENAVRDMLAATTPQDPMYSKLLEEQASAPTRWKENRDSLRRDVMNLLTPAQRARFEQSSPAQ